MKKMAVLFLIASSAIISVAAFADGVGNNGLAPLAGNPGIFAKGEKAVFDYSGQSKKCPRSISVEADTFGSMTAGVQSAAIELLYDKGKVSIDIHDEASNIDGGRVASFVRGPSGLDKSSSLRAFKFNDFLVLETAKVSKGSLGPFKEVMRFQNDAGKSKLTFQDSSAYCTLTRREKASEPGAAPKVTQGEKTLVQPLSSGSESPVQNGSARGE